MSESIAAEQQTTLKQTTLSGYTSDLGEVLISLGLVIMLIFLLAWLLKRFSYRSFYQGEGISIVSSYALSAKEKLLVIEVGEEQFLIGVSPGNIEKISRLKNKLVINKDKSFSSQTFDSFLEKAIKRTSSTNE